jgi:Zn-dependent protease
MDRNKVFELLYITAILLLALPLHEFAHAWVAHRFGDNTAKDQGRLSLNPFRHLDPLGSLMMYVAHFGWAKPVPVDARNFRHKRLGMLLVALAGPFSNLLLAFVSMMVIGLLTKLTMTGIITEGAGWGTTVLYSAFDLLGMLVQINILLAIFNMLPVPPLDGSRVLSSFLPDKWMIKLASMERWIGLAFLLIVIVLPRLTGNASIVGQIIGAVSVPVINVMASIATAIFGL